jgi:Tfp pilus assembly protein PilO
MSGFLDQLNLRPQEKRIVVVATTVVLVVLNGLFVWPKFKEWGKLNVDLTKAKGTLKTYQAEIGRATTYQAQLRKLGEQGGGVAPSEQALDLQRTVQAQAARHSVVQTGSRFVPTAGSTNQFFDEQTVTIEVNSRDEELVNFLVALGSGDSMIRVRDMMLKPDNLTTRYRLQGTLTLVASYQKKPKATLTSASRPGAPKAVPSVPAGTSAPPATPTKLASGATNAASPMKGKP